MVIRHPFLVHFWLDQAFKSKDARQQAQAMTETYTSEDSRHLQSHAQVSKHMLDSIFELL